MTASRFPNINNPKGRLIIIGGHEEKDHMRKREVLSKVAEFAGHDKLVIATVASEEAAESFADYKKVFGDLGIKKLAHLNINSRHDAFYEDSIKALKGARGIFFTGGDQLKITSGLGGTEVCQMIHQIYADGGFIAGTSAGASVMSDTMMVSGPSDSSVRSQKSVLMAPGLGFVKEFIIDQHFSERGRMSRLMAAVALNPKYLGLGIDEDTAIVFERADQFEVIGAGAAYIVNGERSTDSNISTMDSEEALSVFNVRIDVLSKGNRFNIQKREPFPPTPKKRKDSEAKT